MAKTLVYQIYLFGFLEKGKTPTRFYKESPIAKATQHLKWVKNLDTDVVWLGPIFESPWHDHGYDITNYYHIEPYFGSMADFDEFVRVAHEGPKPLKVIIDLVLNHTSISNRWFDTHPEYYCWSMQNHSGWRNLFNNGPAWGYCEDFQSYYLHSFHASQADLNWFPDGSGSKINQALVDEFRKIIDFWVKRGVDGFRLDIPQVINKDFLADKLRFRDLLIGTQATDVINAVFAGHEDLFLMMECFDPEFGEVTNYYIDNTLVDFVCNVLIKDEIVHGELGFIGLIKKQSQNHHFLLDLESHDSPRFISREIVDERGKLIRETNPEDAIWYLFNFNAEGVCLYQGQELGLDNPSKEDLPDELMLKLDTQTAMRYVMGEDPDNLRPYSRANARIPLPLDEYERQIKNPSSYFNLTKRWIQRWRAQ